MQILRRLVSFIAIVLVVTNCVSQPLPLPNTTVSPLDSPLPTLTPVPPLVISTPSPGKGIVTGTFLAEDQGGPMVGIDVFLGQMIGSTSDISAPVFGMDLKTAPHAVTDQYGRFVFTDIAPGKYVIILWNPISSSMAKSADGQSLTVTVESQKTVTVGTLKEPVLGR